MIVKYKTDVKCTEHENYKVKYINVPKKDAQELLSLSKRFLLTLNNSNHIHCAIASSNGSYFVMLGKYFNSILKVNTGDKVEVRIEVDNSEYGAAMPIELEECLATDDEAADIFYGLTPGRIRTAMFHVAKAKSEATRIKRALTILENIKNGIIYPQKFTRANN